MLYSNQPISHKLSQLTLLLSALLILTACMPESGAPKLEAGNTTDTSKPTPTTPTYGEPTYPLGGIFVQEGATQSSTNFAVPLEFSDSFLIRGSALSKYLRGLGNTTKFCLVGKYNYVSGANRFLVLSAKPRSFTDLIKKTTEFYLQVEPANDAANQNDCLTYNLTNQLFANVPSATAHFSLTQLCANCSNSVTSSGLRLYFVNGEEVPTVSVNSLLLTISGASGTTGLNCSENTSCRARGFDCCLNSQCVSDRALKPGVLGQPGLETAQADVASNPDRYVLYPQFYFVCGTRPDEDTTPDPSTTDPDYEASIRILELTQLYNCINPIDGEFSHCTLKYQQADKLMPRVFSAADDGYRDDVNFSALNPVLGIGDKANNIVKITYAGVTSYEQGKTPLTGGTFVPGTVNDDLNSAQGVELNLPLPANARDANLYISYKVDGTCERLSATLSKCTKTYIHGSSDRTTTTWHDLDSQAFPLPAYADLSPSASVIVKVSGVVVPDDAGTWTKSTAPNRIVFANSYTLYQNQKVEITYFVRSGAADLVKLRYQAQSRVNSMCACAGTLKCNLTPVVDPKSKAIVNYECTYPTPGSTEPPANQTVFVSNKNIPHRYFDAEGVSYDESAVDALPQEALPRSFSYTNNDLLKPNNVNQYVGFNEIYGSFATTGTFVAKPAKLVRVKKDKLYDIIVNSGGFSSCASCGADYYSGLQRIFPQNFSGQGGGYAPDLYESRRENNTGIYRGDDLLYGRACFVPATMIPWTHRPTSGTSGAPRDQRRARLQGQHFLFANGYSRDWFGFDYGSLIGSFDGVTWFSIGNQRRIKASTSKLFLAVNAYLGDLNVDNNFNVTVAETSAFSSDIPDHDTESDGAQCQRSHYCANDNDCFRQLGYDYTCQSVATFTTPWPQFDAAGAEVIGSTTRTLSSILGGTNGQARRCVYRGRGAPCLPNLALASTTTTFNGATSAGALLCSPNNSCLSLATPNRFNDRIARFGNTPVSQNAADAAPTASDTVGLGARIILRPFDYYGVQSAPAGAQGVLNANGVSAICVPGRDVNTASGTFDLNQRHPSNRTETSDKLFGVGPASSSAMTARSLSACPATDATGVSLQIFDLAIGNSTLNLFTISQNMSSNLLNLPPLVNTNIFSSTAGSQVTSVGYQRNACLRAPGASCFSDMECAPSAFMASKARSSTNLASFINSAEVSFWSEDLVCGNPDFKYVSPGALNPTFDLKKNKCCREFGKTLSVHTQTTSSTFKWCNESTSAVRVAGVNQSISDFSRYSRVHTAYDKMTCNRGELPGKSFALSIEGPTAAQRMEQILGQYKTLDTLNQRTCCTNHWVRSFDVANGGGNAFTRTKMQNIDKSMFRSLSWNVDRKPPTIPFDDPDSAFECGSTQYTNSSCEIKSLTPTEETTYLTWAGALELIGIPQVAVKTDDQVYKLVDDTQDVAQGVGVPLTTSTGQQISLPVTAGTADFQDASGKFYYSAANYTRLNLANNGMKKIFSESQFNCCIPSGQEVPEGTTPGQCCTGFVATTSTPRRCCLPDFTNVTVYLNRYVSSEGRGLPETAYDPATGYIKDPGQAQLMASQKNLCCSGQTATGVAISQLPIPLTDGTFKPRDSGSTTRRFTYRTDAVDNNEESGSVGSVFDAGVRWNNHVYCVPAGF